MLYSNDNLDDYRAGFFHTLEQIIWPSVGRCLDGSISSNNNRFAVRHGGIHGGDTVRYAHIPLLLDRHFGNQKKARATQTMSSVAVYTRTGAEKSLSRPSQ